MKKLLLALATTLLLNAENFTNSLGMEFVTIPSGSFMMGRDAAFEDGSDDELPQHRVSVKKFAMMTTEVTQSQWVKVMGSNPSKFKGRSNPVGV
jgi:formylglycine-generating enzyme required for sulfatase activity